MTSAHGYIRYGQLNYSASFWANEKPITLRGYIRKGDLFQDMKAAGATKEQIADAKKQLAGITKRKIAIR